MAFLDGFDKKLTMLGQGAIQKTREVTDSAKLSSALKTLETQKKEAFSELGSMYYEIYKQFGGSVGEEAAAVIKRIEEIEQQIFEKKDQMQKVKGVIYCTNCNAEIPVGSAFCNICGSKVEAQNTMNYQMAAEVQQNTGKICGHCGYPLEEGQLFCTNCGTKVLEIKMESESAVEETKPEVQTSTKLEENVQEDTKSSHIAVCPGCGAEITEEQAFCTVCGMGTAWRNIDESVPIEKAVPKEKVCPSCGSEVGETQRFCTACGTRLE